MIIKDLVAYLKNLPENILWIEARHVIFCDAPNGVRNDYHMVKEIVHYKDGTSEPRVVLVEDYQRPFYITKQGFQDHLEKKEWEKKERLLRFLTTESQMNRQIGRVLATMQPNPRFKKWSEAPRIIDQGFKAMMNNPWVYGADVKAATLIKRTYQQRFASFNPTPSSLAMFDIETDVVNDNTNNIITMATLSYRDRVVTAIDKKFLHGYNDSINELMKMFNEYLSEDVKNRKITWEVVIVDSPVAIIRHVFRRAHEWKPDFIGIWNINFDIKKVKLTLERAGVKLEDIFCDPLIPKRNRHCEYIEGRNVFVTSSGKRKPLKWAEQWHTFDVPASFYFIDNACAYKRIRTGSESDEPSYALDAIMKKHLAGRGKLKFEQGSHLGGLAWHKYMQSKYPLHYCIYNPFDCIGPELLDEETNDIRLTLPMMAGSSSFQDFSSQPRCSADNLHFFAQTKGYILGTTGKDMKHELDSLCVGLDGWICTLPAANIAMNGLCILEDWPTRVTNIRIHVGDLDVAASYPNGGAVFNVSKDTTVRELHRIEGVDYEDQREQGLNLSGGHTNAVEFMTVICKSAELDTLLDAFLEDEGLPPIQIGPVAYPSTLAEPLYV